MTVENPEELVTTSINGWDIAQSDADSCSAPDPATGRGGVRGDVLAGVVDGPGLAGGGGGGSGRGFDELGPTSCCAGRRVQPGVHSRPRLPHRPARRDRRRPGGPYRAGIHRSASPVPDRPQARAAAAGRRHPLALIALGVVLYSTGPVLLQASDVSGPVFSFWRLWIGAAVLILAAAAVQVRRGPLDRSDRDVLRWPLLAGCAFGVHQLMFFSAVRMTSVVDVALMNALAPVVTAVGAWWLFGERPGRRFVGWSAVAIAGGAVLALGAAAGPTGNPGGIALAAGNVVFFAAFFLVSKRSRDAIAVLPFLAGVMLVSAVLVTAYVVVAGEPVGSASGRDVALAAAVALGPGALGHAVMTWPLRWVPANVPPVMRLAQPAIAGWLALVLLGEPITALHVLGGLVVVVGAALAITSRDGRALRREAAAVGSGGRAPATPRPWTARSARRGR